MAKEFYFTEKRKLFLAWQICFKQNHQLMCKVYLPSLSLAMYRASAQSAWRKIPGCACFLSVVPWGPCNTIRHNRIILHTRHVVTPNPFRPGLLRLFCALQSAGWSYSGFHTKKVQELLYLISEPGKSA